jgi:hypothetical protein
MKIKFREPGYNTTKAAIAAKFPASAGTAAAARSSLAAASSFDFV